MLYNPRPSFGSTVVNSVNTAKNEGYDVLGAINGEFFVMQPEIGGTLTGISVTNGKITSDFAERTSPAYQAPSASNYENVLAVDKDCNFFVGPSRIKYHLYVDGQEIGDGPIAAINKRYYGNNWWDPICYFDKDCGERTYSTYDAPGVEVICQKLNNTDLVPEGTLEAEVLLVNTNTYGTRLAANNWFVLYNQADHMWYDTLCALKRGQKIRIYAEETVTTSKDAMKKAVTVSSANYPIILDGTNNLDNILYKDPGLSGKASPPRVAIGQKEDGTVLFLCSGSLTLDELTNEMIALGCKTAINLDGGGSTTMWTEDGVKCYFEGAVGRAVGSTFLAAKRNEKIQSPSKKALLNTLVQNIKGTSYSGTKAETITKLLGEADAILADANATSADYQRLYMDLQAADAQA